MENTVRKQILAVRDTGKTNMLDVNMVQRIAFELDFHELVDYIAENRTEYMQFIFTGKTN